MRKIFLVVFILLLSNTTIHAQDSTSRFGLGYSLGTNGAILASWMTGCCRIEPQIGFTYGTSNPSGQYYSTSTTESATIGLGFSWVSNVEKNLNILYGPRVLVTANKYNSTTIDNFGTISDTSIENYKYLTTSAQLFIGPEYLLGKHFTISATLTPTISFRGNPTYDPPYSSSLGTSFTFSLGGNIAARYYF